MKYFYSHIIEMESIIISLDELNLSSEQKMHLADLVDATVHQTVLDAILSKLSNQDKEIFLQKLQEDPKDKKLMDFIADKVDNIEDEIKNTVKLLKEELHEDLKEAKKKGE